MTFTRKLLALSAISALSFAFTACGDDGNDSKKDPAPTPSAECTADACAADGVTLNKCNNGKIEAVNCGANGQICTNNACADKPADAPACTADACDTDGVTLLKCEGGVVNRIKCSDANQICSDNKCADKPAEETPCTAADDKCEGNVRHFCNAAFGKMETQNCADGDMICDNKECIAKEQATCTAKAKKCSGDDTYIVCDSKGKWGTDQKCGNDKICSGEGECVDKPAQAATVIGQPCTCEGNDCHFTISGKEIKAALGDAIMQDATIGAALSTLLPDTANITAPNYFSSGIKGCEGLVAPEGMDVGCFTSDKITFDNSYVTLLSTAVTMLPIMLKDQVDLSKIKVDDIQKYVEKILKDGIPFTAKNGYCLLADIDIDLNVTSTEIAKYVKMDEVKKLLAKVNTPKHNHAKAKTAKCPDGSVLLTYDVDKETPDMGSAKVGFDMCLKSCTKATEKTDCRVADGYSCVELPNGVPTEEKPDVDKVSVCFDQANIKYFEDMTNDFKAFLPAGEGE